MPRRYPEVPMSGPARLQALQEVNFDPLGQLTSYKGTNIASSSAGERNLSLQLPLPCAGFRGSMPVPPGRG